MAAAEKLPAIQWYPGDWKKDAGVQSLDYYDRGVWWEILQIMHCSPRRGVLVWPTGEAMDDDSIAQLLGIDPEKWKQVRSRLLSRGVASVEQETGALYNRRMLRDEGLRQAKADAGRKGGQAKGKQTPSKTQAKRGSSSSSSSSASAGGAPPPAEPSKTEADGVAEPKQNPESAIEPTTSATHEVREIDRTIAAFGFTSTPGLDAKRRAIEDLRRMGMTHTLIRAAASAAMPNGAFYPTVRKLEKDWNQNGNGSQKVRENAAGERHPVLAERREEVQRRQDDARAAVDKKLSELNPDTFAEWTREAEETAERANIPAGARQLFIQTELRKRAAKQYSIEGL